MKDEKAEVENLFFLHNGGHKRKYPVLLARRREMKRVQLKKRVHTWPKASDAVFRPEVQGERRKEGKKQGHVKTCV